MTKRIDLTQFEGLELYEVTDVTGYTTLDLVAELKRCYERIDYLEAKVSYLECEIAETEYQQGHHRYVD